jgi:glycosyltransferase involved in cell wall biosynthesis
MKIFHFPRGGQMREMCKGLKEIGIDATECNFLTHPFYGNSSDINLNLQSIDRSQVKKKIQDFFLLNHQNYDVFHYHMVLSLQNLFSPTLDDFRRLKQQGKKMVIQHNGSEVRRLSLARLNNPYIRKKEGIEESEIVTSLNQLSEIFDHAIVADYELYGYVKEFYRNVHIIPQAIDLKNITPVYPALSKERPLIVHAPSNRKIKGTDYILDAIQRLQKEGYQFDFKLIEKMSNQAAMQLYSQSDIIIDQLCIGAHGIFSIEAMALGKPVICFIREDLTKKYPLDLPIVNANPITIYEILKDLLINPQKRNKIGTQSRKYVEQRHDHVLIGNQLVKLYNKL